VNLKLVVVETSGGVSQCVNSFLKVSEQVCVCVVINLIVGSYRIKYSR